MEEEICPLCLGAAERRFRANPLGADISCERCGFYSVRGTLRHGGEEIRALVGDKLYILSGLTRRAFDAGGSISITATNLHTLLESAAVPRSPLEQMDRVLLYISQVQESADQLVLPNFQRDYPLVFARDDGEFEYFLDTLVGRGLLETREPLSIRDMPGYRLSPAGWAAVESLRRSEPDSNQAFVAMWFTEKLDRAWEDGFKPALETTGFTPFRVDLAEHNGKIDDLIVAEIRRSGLLVADFTGNRGGVYFESGFAMGLGIYVIRTCRDTDIDEVHFDTRQYNHIVWDTPEDLNEKLQNRIAATIPGRASKRSYPLD